VVGNGSLQGASVALSADGNTAIVGGPFDNRNSNNGDITGAVWVFTRTSGIWTQQGGKLVGAGAANGAIQGSSVAVSADGNTAIVGGPDDADGLGAAWVFTRKGDVWTQLGNKLVGAGAVYTDTGVQQGSSVALSGNGKTAIVGGPTDNSGAGAAWVFDASFYFYSGAQRSEQEQTTTLIQGELSIDKPTLGKADSHSLAEVAISSTDDNQAVEVGWTVDEAMNHDALPHLFVFYWVNGQPQGYNTPAFHVFNGAHYVPTMSLASKLGSALVFSIGYRSTSDCEGWWIRVQSEYIGCYPASLWNGEFTKGGHVQWFGEVSASSPAPHTQMGDGLFAINPRSASINNMIFSRRSR
jgi:Neprosin